MVYVCELPIEKQFEIKNEVAEIYSDLGYSGEQLENAIERCMNEKLVNVTDLIGWYKWYKESEVRNAEDEFL